MKFVNSILMPLCMATLLITTELIGQIDQPGDDGLISPSSLSASQTTGEGFVEVKAAVQLIDDIDLPALESGPIVKMFVKPGDTIARQQMVVQMDDKIAQRMLEEATLKHRSAGRRANDNTEIEAAIKKTKLARSEFEDIAELYRRKSKSKHDRDRADYAAQISELEIQAAKNAKELATIDVETEMVRVNAARDTINRQALKSPVDGIVFETDKEEGEWVTAGERVMRIARVDRLRIVGFVEQHDPSELVNKSITVTYEMARGRTIEFTGKIVFVKHESLGGKLRFHVWGEVDNRQENGHWLLHAGSDVKLRIHLDSPAPTGSSITQN
jgi:multidrug efflux pump subunit AcrA (membrane-fusion protein)